MAALNFPDPNVTTSYTNADTGISYEWSNNVWKAVRSAQTAPELFVNAAGDNVTGNLTFGTDKIVLNATTGAASFASAVDATEFTVNGSPIGGAGSQTLVSDTMPTPGDYEVGTMWWNSDASDTSLYVLYQDPTGPTGLAGDKHWVEAAPAPDSIGFDGTHTGDSTFTGNMTVTGSATFASNITLGTWANTSDSAIYMANQADSGQIIVKGNGSSSQSAFSVYSGGWSGSSNQVAAIKADGSATFAGDLRSTQTVTCSDNVTNTAFLNHHGLQVRSNTGPFLKGEDVSANQKVLISADGSATFAAGACTIFNQGSIKATSLEATTNIFVKAVAGVGALNVINNSTNLSEFQVIAGDSTKIGYDVSTDPKIILDRSGSAEFSGKVETIGNTAAFHVGTDKSASKVPFNIYDTANGNETIARIMGDGSAVFAGAVQSIFYGVGVNNVGNGVQNEAFAVSSAPNAQTAQTRKLTFYTDGSATFQGYINVNNYAYFSRVINDGYGAYFIATFADSGGNKAYIKGNGIFIGNGLGGANDVTPPSTAIALRTDGSATFTGSITAGNVSDIKFKENIEAAPAQLADIEAFDLKTFDWKDEAPLSDELKAQRKLGLIAQEVEAICPEMVYEVAGQDDDSYKAINHDVLIMKLLGAVKELAAEVAALKAS